MKTGHFIERNHGLVVTPLGDNLPVLHAGVETAAAKDLMIEQGKMKVTTCLVDVFRQPKIVL